jgi:hypothetical protein
LPSGTICTSKFTSLMTPSNSNLLLGSCSNKPAGIVTENVPICRIRCEGRTWDRRQGAVGTDAVGRDVVVEKVCYVDELARGVDCD